MFINKPLPPKANGKPATNKDYQVQGWNAAQNGIHAADCPYYETSTAGRYWLAGHREGSR